MDTEKEIRIIRQGSEDARRVSKAMASSTASELLDALADHPKTASELEAETGYPLPTIQYHMENLLNAGLVKVSRIRYSEKGKPMKLYAVSDTILVISPKKTDEENIRPLLRKYGFTVAVTAIAVAAAVTISKTVLTKFTTSPGLGVAVQEKTALVAETTEASTESDMVCLTSAGYTTDIMLSQINIGFLVFLTAALALLAGMMVFEIVRIKRTNPDRY